MEAFFAEVRPLRICVTVTEINMNDINGVMMPGFTPLHVYSARYGFILNYVNYGRCRFASVEQKHPHRPPPPKPRRRPGPTICYSLHVSGGKTPFVSLSLQRIRA